MKYKRCLVFFRGYDETVPSLTILTTIQKTALITSPANIGFHASYPEVNSGVIRVLATVPRKTIFNPHISGKRVQV